MTMGTVPGPHRTLLGLTLACKVVTCRLTMSLLPEVKACISHTHRKRMRAPTVLQAYLPPFSSSPKPQGSI